MLFINKILSVAVTELHVLVKSCCSCKWQNWFSTSSTVCTSQGYLCRCETLSPSGACVHKSQTCPISVCPNSLPKCLTTLAGEKRATTYSSYLLSSSSSPDSSSSHFGELANFLFWSQGINHAFLLTHFLYLSRDIKWFASIISNESSINRNSCLSQSLVEMSHFLI